MHHAAEIGFSKHAAQYQNGRPDYPAALAGWLQQHLALDAGSTVLDLGAGTGKFTQLLTRSTTQVIAVEQLAAMSEHIQQLAPQALVLNGHAEQIPLADQSVDAVVCAQAFHWFANRAALDEIHRVLRPKGKLCLIWNTRDERHAWVAQISALMRPHEGDAPRYYTGQWKSAFIDHSGFGAPQYQALPHAHYGTFEQVMIDRFMSVSFIAALDAEGQQQFKQQLLALRAQYEHLNHEPIEFPYRTDLWLYDKLD